MMSAVDSKLDENIVALVDALNAFPGVQTIGSCGGHENPGPGQWPAGSWYVNLVFTRDEEGHYALEFLAWLINHDTRKAGDHVILYPHAPPPFLNQPGQVLRFHLEGYNQADPNKLAEFINRMREDNYVSPP